MVEGQPSYPGPANLLRHVFFFFNDTATTEIYTLSLHDALPISVLRRQGKDDFHQNFVGLERGRIRSEEHTSELQSPYVNSYAVFCLKKNTKKNIETPYTTLRPAPTPSAISRVR